MRMIDRYLRVITLLCNYYGFEIDKLMEIIEQKENMYLFLLLMKEYDCMDENIIKDMSKLKTKRSIKYNIKKAEEKLLVNKYFRDKYYKIAKG